MNKQDVLHLRKYESLAQDNNESMTQRSKGETSTCKGRDKHE
jgi:hypothetical protein